MMFNYIDDILKAPVTNAHDTIGLSRENRPVKAAVIGRGNMNISLIAGCMEWPNPQWQAWQTKLNNWKTDLLSEKKSGEEIACEIKQAGILPMPADDQMRLQWRFISAAVEQVKGEYKREALF